MSNGPWQFKTEDVPPEEILPMTRAEKAETIRILEEAERDGLIDLNDFTDRDVGDAVGTKRWKERLDEYFAERGTTPEAYWESKGFDWRNEIEWIDPS